MWSARIRVRSVGASTIAGCVPLPERRAGPMRENDAYARAGDESTRLIVQKAGYGLARESWLRTLGHIRELPTIERRR